VAPVFRCGYKDRYVFYGDFHVRTAAEEVPQTHLVEAHGFLFCLSGQMRVLVEGSEYAMGPDDLLLVRDAEAHRIWVTEFPCTYVNAYFSLHYFYLFDPEYRLLGPFLDRPLGVGNLIGSQMLNAALLRQSFENIAGMPDAYLRRIAVLGALTVTLGEIHRIGQSGLIDRREARPETTRNVLNYVNDHYTEPMEPDEIATNLFVSRSQIDRIIKQATGLSLWHYVTAKRLIHARHLLHSGVMIRDAASQSGFRDYSTFYKAFLKVYGAPPRAERPSDASDPMLRQFYQLDDTSQIF
jgi:AraC-like DNA-binding protein